MKLTLLEIVQDIQNDLESVPSNSIDDTPESLQIARIVKTTYYELINRRDWFQHRGLIQLEASGDNTKPTFMTMPTNVREIEWIKYNKRDDDDTRDKFAEVVYLPPEEFLRWVNDRDTSLSTTTTVTDDSGVEFTVWNDRAPERYTSFDDNTLVFDGFNSDVDTTLQKSKTQVWAVSVPTWTEADGFFPDLPVDGFPLLVAEAKSVAFITLRQSANSKAEQQSVRQHRKMARKHFRVMGGISYPDYGRRRPWATTSTRVRKFRRD